MAVDKNLFLYDLAVVAIMKNEGPYVKEWLDYHLLAGVDHFYIYDHESTDNFKEILKPYIDAGIVTYIFFPGELAQNATYNDAVNKYKFFCRYIAFIDADEFIFPQNNKSVVEVVDEILADKKNAGGLGINWRMFGSNNLETADYSKGVLERFTRRQENFNIHVKTVANPRTVKSINIPHFAFYFENFFAVNENGNPFQGAFNEPPTGAKICINHYHTKSKEEYLRKVQRGRVDTLQKTYKIENFKHANNEVFDDGILKYRENRVRTLIPDGGGRKMCLKIWRQASRLTIRNCA